MSCTANLIEAGTASLPLDSGVKFLEVTFRHSGEIQES